MKLKNKLRIIEILLILAILLTVISIQRTYAKYFEKIGTTYNTNIKKWVIRINNTNIHEKDTLNGLIQPVLVEDENMNNNETLVPGRIGYFDMTIDYTYVDLAFDYKFKIDQQNSNKLADFEIFGYSIVDGDEDNIIETKEIAGTINPETDINGNNKKSREIKVWFRWNDGEGSTMSNMEDTQFVGETNQASDADGLHKVLNYNATITFIQHVDNQMS